MAFRFTPKTTISRSLARFRKQFQPAVAALSALVAAGLFVWILAFFARFGGHFEGRLAAIIGVGFGFAGAPLVAGSTRRVIGSTLAVWAIAQPIFAGFVTSLLGEVPVSFVESAAGRALFVVIAGLVALTPGVLLGVAATAAAGCSRAVGAAVGFLIAWAILPFVPLWGFGVAVAVGIVAISWRCPPLGAARIRGGVRLRSSRVSVPSAASDLGSLVAGSIVFGFALRFVGQWFHWTPGTVAAIGVSAALAALVRVRWQAGTMVAVSSAVMLAGYGVFVSLGLVSATFESSLATVVGGMVLTGMACFGPAVVITDAGRFGRGSVRALAVVGGTCVGISAVTPPVLTLVLCAVVGFAATIAVPSVVRLSFSGVAAAACLGAALAGQYAPQDLPRILHSPAAIAMASSGESRANILAADEARFASFRETPEGTLTAWSLRGFQVAFARDGELSGSLTKRTELGPRLGADVLAAVLPLTMHPNPEHVCVWGVGNGETLLTTTDFGVPKITLSDDSEQINFVIEHAGERAGAFLDSRVTIQNVPAEWAAAVAPVRADVLIVDRHPIGDLRSAAVGTDGYVAGLARQVNKDGLVCVRIDTTRSDANRLLRQAAAFHKEFSQVFTFEIGPGQWAIVAAKTEAPLLDLAFCERLERDNVRGVLGQVGWDWSLVADLHMIGPRQLATLLADTKTAPDSAWTATAARTDRWLACSRSSEKGASFANLLGPHLGRPLNYVDDAGVVRDIEARLADARERDRLLGETVDDHWAYRAALKDRLTTRPRAAIQQVGYSDDLQPALHPEDERRKQYLATLATALSGEDASLLDDFIHPYDPLVSYFVHGEASRIYAEAGQDEAAFEHNVASVFKTYNDPSVRPVLDALELLDATGSERADERYDFAQGLLEQLRRRWHARTTQGGDVMMSANTIRASVTQTRETLEMLDQLVAQHPVLAEHWMVRRPILHRDLVERLRMHQRSEQQRRLRVEQTRAMLRKQREADVDSRDTTVIR